MRSKRSKATDISYKTKYEVWERDNHRCIFCGSTQAMPNAHYIPRSKGGLGVPQNVVTACNECHFKMDNSKYRKEYLSKTREYLKSHYPGWYEEDLIYAKN